MPITVTIGGDTYELDPDKDTSIDPGDLDGEFINLSSLANRYGLMAEESQAEAAYAKYELSRVYAIIDHRVRSEADLVGAKLTEKKVENSVFTDKDYVERKRALLKLERDSGLIRAVLYALRVKQECLISLAANMRSTGGGAVRSLSLPEQRETFRKVTTEVKQEKASEVVRENRQRRKEAKEAFPANQANSQPIRRRAIRRPSTT